MSKTNKILAGFGVATALGIAISPLAVFADDPTTVDGETTINAIIEEVISMSLVSSDSANPYNCNSAATPNCSGTDQSATTTILPSQADTDSMYTIVTINTKSVNGYNLTLADSDTNNALVAPTGTIAAIASEPVGGTNPGWAIAVDKASQTGTITWLQVPISTSTPPLTIKSHHPSPAAVTVNDVTTVTYGVAASSSQPTGIYTDTVVYTATTGV